MWKTISCFLAIPPKLSVHKTNTIYHNSNDPNLSQKLQRQQHPDMRRSVASATVRPRAPNMSTRGSVASQKSWQPYPVCVRVGVEVAVEQRLERRDRRDRLGEAVSSVLAVLQVPVPHGGQRRVGRIRGGIRMEHVSPAVDWCVGLPEVLGGAG